MRGTTASRPRANRPARRSIAAALGGSPTAVPFQLMQGQRILLTVTIAAFATLWGDATILLFFVLPIRARWCLWLGILLGFVAYLGSKDLAGFAGICAGTAITALALSPAARGRLPPAVPTADPVIPSGPPVPDRRSKVAPALFVATSR